MVSPFDFPLTEVRKYTPTFSHTVGKSQTGYGGKAVELHGLGTLIFFIPLDSGIPFLGFIFKE